jgi:hypothetical protein
MKRVHKESIRNYEAISKFMWIFRIFCINHKKGFEIHIEKI